jgi:hypothetical protein
LFDDEELCDWYVCWSPDVRTVKHWRQRRDENIRTSCRIAVGKSHGERLLRRPRKTQKDHSRGLDW